MGSTIGVIKGDIWSLDYGLYVRKHQIGSKLEILLRMRMALSDHQSLSINKPYSTAPYNLLHIHPPLRSLDYSSYRS